MWKVTGPPTVSASLAVTVPTAVAFSATLNVAELVITGGLSFASVRESAVGWGLDRAGVPLSVAVTVTSYTLSPLASPGTSKSGAALKVSTPPGVMLNLVWSDPPVIEKGTVWQGRWASVAVTVSTAVVFSGTFAVLAEVKTGLLSLTDAD